MIMCVRTVRYSFSVSDDLVGPVTLSIVTVSFHFYVQRVF